jgi:signal transduction histidine kinase
MLAGMAWLGRDSRRTVLVAALLVASFLLTAFLAFRGLAAARSRQITAEGVVRDWTRAAMDELARRVEAQAAFYGTYPVLQAMASAPKLLSPADLAAAATNEEMRRSARLVRATLRYDASGGLEVSGGAPAEAVAWLGRTLPALAAAPPPPPQQKPLHAAFGDGERTFVWALTPAAQRAAERGTRHARTDRIEPRNQIVGFEVEIAALAPFFEQAIAASPLLPPSLAEGRIGNDSICVRVTDPRGGEVFRSPAAPNGPLAVRKLAGDGLLRGMTFDAMIAPKVVPLLILGGLAQPDAAMYLVPLLLAAGLLVTAVLQLRKERALARWRSEFVASVSHELRTPLTQIRMFAETLALDRVRSPEERRRSLAVIDQEARRLAQLVENVLQFSRGERGMLSLVRRPLDLVALTRETLTAFAPIAAARGVRVIASLPPTAVALADQDALRQVLLNLLDNAVKYGPNDQEVLVAVEVTTSAGAVAPGVRLSVDDQGPGVPARDRRRIWHRYQRLERERERAIAGAGIGLAVVRDLVTLHGGRVRVEDSARGGARFVIELPADLPAEARP